MLTNAADLLGRVEGGADVLVGGGAKLLFGGDSFTPSPKNC